MKNIVILIVSFAISSCGIEQDSYLVRWWNGNIPTKLSSMEQQISDFCYKKNEHLPRNSQKERKEASLEYIKCTRNKEKELGIR